MSKEGYDWAMNYPAKDATQRCILQSMGYVADAHGWNSYQALSTLAKDGVCSERTVSRHLRELIEECVIEVTAPSRRSRPTTYRLVALDPEREYDPDRTDDKMSRQRRTRKPLPEPPPERASLAIDSPLTRQWLANGTTEQESSPYIGTGSGSTPTPSGVAVQRSSPKPPNRDAAHELAEFAWKQPVRPAIAAGKSGSDFCAARDLIERHLDAGEEAATVRAAIAAGGISWTTAGLGLAIQRQKPKPTAAGRAEPAGFAAIRSIVDKRNLGSRPDGEEHAQHGFDVRSRSAIPAGSHELCVASGGAE